MCKHCDKGCMIHDSKPKECSLFDCMYLQVDVSEELRPDKCKVIFEKLSDHVIHATLDSRFELKDIVKKQMDAFVKQGFTVILGASDFRKPIVWRLTEQI